MWAQLLDLVSFSFLDVHFDPYLPSEAQKLWLRNAFRNDWQTMAGYCIIKIVCDPHTIVGTQSKAQPL